ncbi:hypothetical protein Vadar_004777 [Vaccinium darrowii]|uniref:Uncharacterized protein n=1 Tax=Vaccinium darrowii TaxID=229202 RepID=A0ACB7YKA6_9ERIC|nr:hypothetical protein Vadar_004777 [Vaccinium darrowii]
MCYCYAKPAVASVRWNGRPSRTVDSDFSTHYAKKVEEGKSRLSALFLSQAIVQLISVLYILSSTKKDLDPVALASTVIALLSILIGELGRRRSRVSLLMVSMFTSYLVTMISLGFAFAHRSHLVVEVGPLRLSFPALPLVIGDTSRWKMLQLLTVLPFLLGWLLQILSVRTMMLLMAHIMRSTKRAF